MPWAQAHTCNIDRRDTTWLNRPRLFYAPDGMAPPRGHYSHATRGGGLIFVSGQLPVAPDGTVLHDQPLRSAGAPGTGQCARRAPGGRRQWHRATAAGARVHHRHRTLACVSTRCTRNGPATPSPRAGGGAGADAALRLHAGGRGGGAGGLKQGPCAQCAATHPPPWRPAARPPRWAAADRPPPGFWCRCANDEVPGGSAAGSVNAAAARHNATCIGVAFNCVATSPTERPTAAA